MVRHPHRRVIHRELFSPHILSEDDRAMVAHILKDESRLLRPDFVISPDGEPYLYRWHVVPRNERCNVYLHIQVASDPERPLHDHPWDNQSVILAGGYEEQHWPRPPKRYGRCPRLLVPGVTIHREAEEAHRLILPEEHPYSISLFSTGPVRRLWGFWFEDKREPYWLPHTDVLETAENVSVWKPLEEEK